jgi:hypothetical protein
MIIENDTNLSGGGVDPAQVFKDARVQPPKINPGAFAGLVPPPPNAGPRMPVGMPGVVPGAPPAYSPPPPPNPLYGAMRGTTIADDEMPY